MRLLCTGLNDKGQLFAPPSTKKAHTTLRHGIKRKHKKSSNPYYDTTFCYSPHNCGCCITSTVQFNNDGKNITRSTYNKSTNSSSQKKDSSSYNFKCLIPTRVVQVSSGRGHTALLTDDGRVYMVGSNTQGQLGVNPTKIPYSTSPRRVEFFDGLNVKSVHCGGNTSFAITDNGKLFAWGCNNHGLLANGSSVSQDYHVRQVYVGDSKYNIIESMSAGYQHSGCVDKNRRAWMWGYNGLGQLGLGDRCTRKQPTRVDSIDHDIQRVICGFTFTTLFVTTNGLVYGCGNNATGQVCQLSAGQESIVRPRLIWENARCLAPACGHTAIVTHDNELLVRGQIGDHKFNDWTPVPPSSQDSTDPNGRDQDTSSLGVQIIAAISGCKHTLCLTGDGDVFEIAPENESPNEVLGGSKDNGKVTLHRLHTPFTVGQIEAGFCSSFFLSALPPSSQQLSSFRRDIQNMWNEPTSCSVNRRHKLFDYR
eukprot:gb/GECH01001274.1/.p1 GENE.gb/GECH01001274.1/~~gb/GECH01001274.1/.p1  ORF type:complete len:479 (+),score=72.63 gb/GECH01001274.1/:1-1437(+)